MEIREYGRVYRGSRQDQRAGWHRGHSAGHHRPSGTKKYRDASRARAARTRQFLAS